MSRSLKDRVAIVTGGAVRVGAALVEALADEGVRVLLHYGSSHEPAANLKRRLVDQGRVVQLHHADLAQPVAAARSIVQAAIDAFGHVDMLINNAAIFEAGTIANTTEESWDRQLAINLKAPFFLAQEFNRHIANNPSRSGDIINILDWRGTHPLPGHAAYTTSKAGLVAQTKLMAQELAPLIRVNGIALGAILPAPGTSPAAWDNLRQLIPLDRTGCPADIAQALLYLLQAEFVTGEIIHVTGGQHLRR